MGPCHNQNHLGARALSVVATSSWIAFSQQFCFLASYQCRNSQDNFITNQRISTYVIARHIFDKMISSKGISLFLENFRKKSVLGAQNRGPGSVAYYSLIRVSESFFLNSQNISFKLPKGRSAVTPPRSRSQKVIIIRRRRRREADRICPRDILQQLEVSALRAIMSYEISTIQRSSFR